MVRLADGRRARATDPRERAVIELNPGAEQTFGFRRADIVGKPVAELLIPPALRAQHERGLERFLASGEGPILGQRMEYTALRADRTEFPIEITVTQLDLPGPPWRTSRTSPNGSPRRNSWRSWRTTTA